MRKSNTSRSWTTIVALLLAVGLVAACNNQKAKFPTQPQARNFENPQTSIVTANFNCAERGGDDMLTVIFRNLSLGSIDAFFWDFGDGGSSTAASPVHTYAVAGSYLVILTVSNSISSDTFADFCDAGETETEEAAVPSEEG